MIESLPKTDLSTYKVKGLDGETMIESFLRKKIVVEYNINELLSINQPSCKRQSRTRTTLAKF